MTRNAGHIGRLHWVLSPALLLPITILPSRSRMSGRDVVSASTAMISDDTVMSKPVVLYQSQVVLKTTLLVVQPQRHYGPGNRGSAKWSC